MTKYTLVYFNIRGRAEIVRQIFVLAGQDFEDYRLSGGEWPNIKPNAPFGQAPLLKIDGEIVLCQSLTIARYLARKFDLAGKTEIDQAKADMIVDCGEDFLKPLMTAFFYSSDEEAKAAGIKKFKDEQMSSGLEKFEKLLTDNGSDVFVGNEITCNWCDLHFVCRLHNLERIVPEPFLEKYPRIRTLKEKVEGNERIKACNWLAKRPDTVA